ncbi:hypothetical protein [Polaribacter tangerinus]|uniref:hypothetical protein n=1 Tax=Polaribacter tangerinus TaxID=1920034 RepID=UPI000B4ACF39|nr:hypothetical protein [Polaribacter tangerinus]
MKKLLLLFVLISSLTLTAQESVLLRLNYQKGDSYTMNVEQSQNMGAQGGVNMKISMDMDVVNVSKDTLIANSKIKTIVMDMLQGGMSMSYDSTVKEEDLDEVGKMMKNQFAPMMKATVITKTTTRGEVTNVQVEPITPGMDQFLQQSGGIKYPKEKVSVGSTWSTDLEQNGLKISTIYKVSKIEDGKLHLNISGAVSGLGTGKLSGNSIIEIATGVQEEATSEILLDAGGVNMKITSKVITQKK